MEFYKQKNLYYYTVPYMCMIVGYKGHIDSQDSKNIVMAWHFET
jgi:hypothetical protein